MAAFESFLEFRGFPMRRASDELKVVQELSQDQFDEWQLEQRWAMVRHHYDHNSFFRSRFASSPPDVWNQIPPLTKSELQRPMRSLVTNGLNIKDLYTANTSGSSGVPLSFVKDKYCHAMTWALIKERYSQLGIGLNSLQARFYGVPLDSRARVSEWLKDILMNRKRFVVFNLSAEALDSFISRFKKSSFSYVYGYTSALVLFADYCQSHGIVLSKCCPTLAKCIVTSEVCVPEDRDKLETAFGVPVIREYGASEFGILAVDSASHEWCVSEENVYLETLDDGRCLVTCLYNRAFPFIRYDIGDQVFLEDQRTREGKRIVKEVKGRTNDIVRLPDGKTLAGLTFYYVARRLLEDGCGVREFIIRQTDIRTFVFDVVSDQALSARHESQIRNQVANYVGADLNVEINRVEKIARLPSGKRKHFFSELDAPGSEEGGQSNQQTNSYRG